MPPTTARQRTETNGVLDVTHRLLTWRLRSVAVWALAVAAIVVASLYLP